MILLKQSKSFNGSTSFFEHESYSTKTKMKFSAFLPKEKSKLNHCLIWLSGLTCNEENFITKSGVQNILKNTNAMIICPDTSPRGLNLPNEHESYDFGSGASFYVNAKTCAYSNNYKMYDYIASELPLLIKNEFGIDSLSLMGHSMGGHGALVIGLREKETFKKISAFSPIVNPMQSPWGEKAFTGYLGEDRESWKQYDATELLRNGYNRSDIILIDQGLSDEFLATQLKTVNLLEMAKEKSQIIDIRYREGYDHSYFYISTFLEDHIKFHLA